MQRKELKKAIKEYSHKTNFYKLSLISKLLKKQEKEYKTFINAIPKVVCLKCHDGKISIEYDDSEYNDNHWLSCENCGNDFDDNVGYKDSLDKLDCLRWCDTILQVLHFENPDIKSLEWQKFCENEMLKMLGLESNKKIKRRKS